MDDKICVVFLCNKAYFEKFLYTCILLFRDGKYRGDICLVIGDDLYNSHLLQHPFILRNKIIVKYFMDFYFDDDFLRIQKSLDRSEDWFKKIFQYHKFHLFNTYFKRWDYIFYLDCDITIMSDIAPMIQSRQPNTLLAHSDAYPKYEWKLDWQFVKHNPYYEKLNKKYNLTTDYFQTTMMLYDTRIIEPDTMENLYNLVKEYPISVTNDQGIVSLYFTNIKPLYKQIQIQNDDTYFYDYSMNKKDKPYIMFKRYCESYTESTTVPYYF